MERSVSDTRSATPAKRVRWIARLGKSSSVLALLVWLSGWVAGLRADTVNPLVMIATGLLFVPAWLVLFFDVDDSSRAYGGWPTHIVDRTAQQALARWSGTGGVFASLALVAIGVAIILGIVRG
jgi:hypothetical protein